MAFILKPQINVSPFCQPEQSFYIPALPQDLLWQSKAVAFDAETRTDERAFDIVEPRDVLRSNGLPYASIQASWPSWTPGRLKSSKTAMFESSDPALDSPSTVAKKLCHVATAQARTYTKNAMQTVIVTRLLGPLDFVLHSQTHDFGIFHLKLSHSSLLLLREHTIEKHYAQ